MLDFRRFRVLTFDCYGTLIDWEGGILAALRPLLAAHGKSLADEELLELYGELEAEAEAGEYQTYRKILEGVARGFGNTARLPLEDDYKEIRRQIWLATDSAYKKALEDSARKRAALENKTRGDDLPDFSKEDPVTSHEKPASIDLDPKRAEALVRQLSALFRSMPEIYRSSVQLDMSNNYTRYLNSEGTEYTRATPSVALRVLAATQATDGMPLGDTVAVYERSVAALPGEEQLTAQVHDMAKRLTELRSAPLVEQRSTGWWFSSTPSAPWITSGHSGNTSVPSSGSSRCSRTQLEVSRGERARPE